MTGPEKLAESLWRAQEAAHRGRVDALTANYRDRRARAAADPVEDFLWVYYSFTPAKLRQWHPGPGVALAGAASTSRSQWKYYHAAADGSVVLDASRFVAQRTSGIEYIERLLRATSARPARFGCYGLHEWAMVYQLPQDELRHHRWPLRLGADGTDAVVQAHDLVCSHHDAFRFFTPAAAPRNSAQLTRSDQLTSDRPGCLHVGMDLYKWAYKLSPGVPSDLTLEAFELAVSLRTLDMRASPYDLRELNLVPIPIETETGKQEFVAHQRELAERAAGLRSRLVEAIEKLRAVASQ